MRRRFYVGVGVLLLAGIAAIPLMPYLRIAAHPLILAVVGRKTVEERLDQYGSTVRGRLAPHFQSAGVPYPPEHVILIGIKRDRQLKVYATAADGNPRLIRSYDVLAASGGLGPKLREGDRQVPEGIYRIESLNPNSRFHLSMRVNYPNAFDFAMAEQDGRTNLGGDIMIHGSRFSLGCLAVGDEAAEDLFVLMADTGVDRVEVILTPLDFRIYEDAPEVADAPLWLDDLYTQIRDRLGELPHP